MHRRLLAPVAVLLAFPAPALAQAEAPQPTSAELGASEYGVVRGLPPTGFSVAPATVVAGAPVTVSVRIDGARRRIRARVVLQGSGRRPTVLGLGRLRTGVTVTRRWTPRLAAGRYTARLVAAGRRLKRVTVTVAPAPAPAPVAAASAGAFPVRGVWSLGGPEARFGARRNGHVHQGQDVFAAENTPLVSPVAGVVYFRRVQPSGAGHYLVIRGGDGRDYVFMHLVAGSETVDKGSAVRAGQQIGRVGHTGAANGSHLHFELWPDGWYAERSQPIDPLPDLRAWAGG